MTDATALAHADAARLWMSRPENPMVVTAVLPLDGPLGESALRDVLRERLLVHDRFRARIDLPRLPWNPPRWREDPHFDLDRHVGRVALPAGSPDALLAFAVSELASSPLPINHPPWRAWIVDGVGPGSVLVVRVHHAIADGVALLGVLFALSDEGAGSLPPLAAPATVPMRASLPTVSSLLRGVGTLAGLVFQGADRGLARKGELGPHKLVAWSKPADVEAVRRAAHAADAHINEVVLAALAGAVRRCFRASPRKALHALVPVALAHAAGDLGNRYASVFVELPVHVADPVARLRLVRAAARRARDGAGLSLGSTLVGALGTLGGIVHHAGLGLLSRRASLVASNVPGPTDALHVGGRTITALRFAAPSPGAIPLSASVASYAGELSLTVLADAHLGVAPEGLARRFDDELATLLSAFMEDGVSP